MQVSGRCLEFSPTVRKSINTHYNYKWMNSIMWCPGVVSVFCFSLSKAAASWDVFWRFQQWYSNCFWDCFSRQPSSGGFMWHPSYWSVNLTLPILPRTPHDSALVLSLSRSLSLTPLSLSFLLSLFLTLSLSPLSLSLSLRIYSAEFDSLALITREVSGCQYDVIRAVHKTNKCYIPRLFPMVSPIPYTL